MRIHQEKLALKSIKYQNLLPDFHNYIYLLINYLHYDFNF